MIVKIVLSVISLSLLVIGFIIDTSTDRQIDYDDKEKRRIIVNQLLHFGVIGILLCISLFYFIFHYGGILKYYFAYQ